MNRHKIIAGLHLAIVGLYWVPSLVRETQDYQPEEFLSELTLLFISLIISFMLLGLFGILGFWRNIKQWMVSVTFAIVAVKQLFDAAWLGNIFFLILFALFLVAAIISQYVVNKISLRNQVTTMNVVGVGLSVWAIVAELVDQL